MRPTILVDAYWPAPAAAPMSRVLCARSEPVASSVAEASASLQLPMSAQALGRQLRELSPVCRCLPGVERLRPLPGGLGGVGDCGLTDGADGPGLLRVRAWRPDGRLWLSLDTAASRLQVDLRWRTQADGSRLDLELQRTGDVPGALPLVLQAFAARLSLWLQTAD